MKVCYTPRLSLSAEIRQVKNPTTSKIRKMYGQFGLDIYEGKENVSILSAIENKTFRKFINNIKSRLGLPTKFDYQEKDTIHDVILKYMCNRKFGISNDIQEKFGERGLEVLHHYKTIGYAG